MIEYLGTLVVTTTAKNNTTTAAPFTIAQQGRLMVQSDAAVYVELVAGAADLATVARGFLLDAAEKFEFGAGERLRYLSGITAAGTANIKVFRVY